MSIGVIGDELPGTVLAKAWAEAGHLIAGLSLTSERAIELADSLLPGVPIKTISDLTDLADLLILAVTDDELEATATGLAELGLLGPRKIVVHLSPKWGYSILANPARTGAIPIAMHPVTSFTGTSLDLVALRNSVVAVTVPEMLRPIAEALVIELGAEPIVVHEYQRAAYAEAFSVADSFSSLVVAQAVGILREAEVLEASQLIAPVVRMAVERALAGGPNRIDPEDAR
jgi:predicted short-subunit dehydrogenase-like oxidoreductase (DUF2520 family)